MKSKNKKMSSFDFCCISYKKKSVGDLKVDGIKSVIVNFCFAYRKYFNHPDDNFTGK